jgi:small conductance mechanosensitive channel
MEFTSWKEMLAGLMAYSHFLLPPLRMLGIVIGAWILIYVLQRAVRSFRLQLAARMVDPEGVRRAETLGRVLRYLIAAVIGTVAVLLILGEFGISLGPLLGAAGIAGVALGFGAQSLVKDFLSGFFILLEDQIRTGDVVKIADLSGMVEEVTLRYVRLRDHEGLVHFVPTGQITTVTNMGRGFAYALIDVPIAYKEDIDQGVSIIRAVAEEMRVDEVFGQKVLEPIEIAGVEAWADASVVLRARDKVKPLEQWNVKREFLRRLKYAFDAANVEIPYPHLTIYRGVTKPPTAAALS